VVSGRLWDERPCWKRKSEEWWVASDECQVIMDDGELNVMGFGEKRSWPGSMTRKMLARRQDF
jgi:hypothetical protein